MRILTQEEMMMVSGGHYTDKDGTHHMDRVSVGGDRARSDSAGGGWGNDNRPSNSGWGARVGGWIAGGAASYVAGKIVPGVAVANSVAGALGRLFGNAVGHTVENGFVFGANSAIDKAQHDAQNIIGRARWSGK